VPGHQRFHCACRQGGPYVREHQMAELQKDCVVVPDQRPVAVLWLEFWVRGSRNGCRTLDGAYQTVFLQKGAYLPVIAAALHTALTLKPVMSSIVRVQELRSAQLTVDRG